MKDNIPLYHLINMWYSHIFNLSVVVTPPQKEENWLKKTNEKDSKGDQKQRMIFILEKSMCGTFRNPRLNWDKLKISKLQNQAVQGACRKFCLNTINLVKVDMFSYRAKKALKLPGEIFFLTYLCLAPVKDISLYMGAVW